MAIESKATVAMTEVPDEEVKQIAKLFGVEEVTEVKRLYGGFSSSNFKIVGVKDQQKQQLLLKIMYPGTSQADAEHQCFVLDYLRQWKFPTNYPHGPLIQHNGRKAMLLDFIDRAVPGQEILANEASKAKVPKLLSDLAIALAQLHAISWPSDRSLRDIYTGFPVCGTGDYLRGEELESLKGTAFEAHPFVLYANNKLEWLRKLYKLDLPWGLIHGDAFLDNTLYEDGESGSDFCKLKALVDWEDSCLGPYVLDLAVCCSACAFTAANELMPERLEILYRAYVSQKPLLAEECQALTDFMLAGALACAFYRFTEFNLRQPNSAQDAKDSFKLMFERAKLLEEGGAARQVAETVLKQLLAAS